jgi:hypothetical protein
VGKASSRRSSASRTFAFSGATSRAIDRLGSRLLREAAVTGDPLARSLPQRTAEGALPPQLESRLRAGLSGVSS